MCMCGIDDGLEINQRGFPLCFDVLRIYGMNAAFLPCLGALLI